MRLDTLPIPVLAGLVVALLIIGSVLSRPSRDSFVNSSYPQHQLAPHEQGGWGGYLIVILVIAALLGTFLYFNPRVLQQVKPSSLSLPSLSVTQAAAVAPPGKLSGGPSLSASFIDKVLQANHSPAQGLGTTLYQLSQQDNIDDAVPLAVFHHESNYGLLGVAHVTLSIGNIRCSPGYRCYEGFRAYASWQDSAKDWFQLIKTVYLPHSLDTVDKMIRVYAPDGGEQAYINSMLADIKRWRAREV
jgi:hypothetical protein